MEPNAASWGSVPSNNAWAVADDAPPQQQHQGQYQGQYQGFHPAGTNAFMSPISEATEPSTRSGSAASSSSLSRSGSRGRLDSNAADMMNAPQGSASALSGSTSALSGSASAPPGSTTPHSAFRSNSPKNIKYVLSMDGGGVRSLASVEFLKMLEARMRVTTSSDWKVTEAFDLFCGTSGGALVTSVLAQRTGDTMESVGNDIFTEENIRAMMDKSCCDKVFGIAQPQPKYTGHGKLCVIKENLPDVPIQQSRKPLVITTYDLQERDTRIWSSDPTLPTSKAPLQQIVHASSSPPVYFPTVRWPEVGGAQMDGGMAGNNPSLVGYTEALRRWPDAEIRVLSVGTGDSDRAISWKSRFWGLFRWAFPLLDVLRSAPGKMTTQIMDRLLHERHVRVQVKIDEIDLDSTSSSDLRRIREVGKTQMWNSHGPKAVQLCK